MNVRQLISDLWEAKSLPRLSVNLEASRARHNDPFYQQLITDFYRTTHTRHARFPLLRTFGVGVALCPLPRQFDEYFMRIEAAARRNVKKARRLGYEFQRIEYNDHLDDIREIHRSAPERQGRMPERIANGEVTAANNPKSTDEAHDYPYFGILKDETLFAYAGCFVCGEICMLETIYGHAARQPDGIVPMLIVAIAEHLIRERPNVRYFSYGTYFGAGITMRRFKRKFMFEPHRVSWQLG